MSKYGSRKITRDGMTFDSLKEYRRFCELRLLEKAGQVKDLQRQVKFVLIPQQKETVVRYSKKTGKRLQDDYRVIEREVAFIADFVYKIPVDSTDDVILWRTVVEDTKGFRTADYILKRKMMLYFHGIRIKET